MTKEELIKSNTWANTPYMEECSCGTFNVVYTQSENHPEYHTQVYVSCTNPHCKEMVEFNLPVN